MGESAYTYGSICSGLEMAYQALEPLGFDCQFVAEIEAFPCAIMGHRIGATRPRYPLDPETLPTEKERKHWRANNREIERMVERGGAFGNRIVNFGDFTRPTIDDYPNLDLLIGGPPCFPAGTQIATRRGFIDIKDVVIGDEVLTHNGRFRPVERVGSKLAPTIVVSGQGHYGIKTTASHPFLAREKWAQSTRRNGKAVRLTGTTAPAWVPAENLQGKFWACVADWPELPIPEVQLEGAEKRTALLGADLFRLAGAYLGDGWARQNERRGSVMLGLNAEKLEQLRPTLDALGAYSVSEERTTKRVTISSRALARWLVEHFGAGAAEKRIPMWALGMQLSWRRALLDGYLLTDGTDAGTSGRKAITVSAQLALSVRMLANSLGYASSVNFQATPDTHVIEGRTVNQRDYYRVTASPSSRSSFEDGGKRWQLVRSVKATGLSEVVYDMTVTEDHSYVADGIAVHNCQAFSNAGKRRGLGDHRGSLTMAYVDLVHDLFAAKSLRAAIYENVPGLLSDQDNAFGCFLGALVGADDALRPPGDGSWPGVGMASGPRARVAWRVLDAQHFRLAQRRRRLFVVICPRDGADPARILFEPQGMRGPAEEGRSAQEDVAGTASVGAQRRSVGEIVDRSLTAVETAPTIRAGGNQTGGHRPPGTDVDMIDSLLPVAFSIMPMNSGKDFVARVTDIAQPVMAGGPVGGNQGGDYIVEPAPFDTTQVTSAANYSNPKAGDPCHPVVAHGHPPAIAYVPELANTLKARWFDASEDGTGRQPALIATAFSVRGRDGEAQIEPESGDVAPAVRTGNGGSSKSFVATYNIAPQDGAYVATESDISNAITGEGERKKNGRGLHIVARDAIRWAVRRLMPTECEALQGSARDWTKIPWHGRPAEECPDGPRYKAIGNSFPGPVIAWLGRRVIAEFQRIDAERQAA